MEDNKKFADGFSFKRSEKAPEFVVGRLSLKVDEAIEFIKANTKNGWLNLNIKQARSGNYYIELDTYEPKTSGAPQTETGGKKMTDEQLKKTLEKVKAGAVTVSEVQQHFDLTQLQWGTLKAAEPVNVEDDLLPF